MKHLLKFFEKKSTSKEEVFDKFVNEKWSSFTKNLFKQYCDKFGDGPNRDLTIEYAVDFFKELDYEYDGSGSVKLYEVYGGGYDEIEEYDIAICEAIGPEHAKLKATLDESNNDEELFDFTGAREITDEYIEKRINTIKEEYERKIKIYERIL